MTTSKPACRNAAKSSGCGMSLVASHHQCAGTWRCVQRGLEVASFEFTVLPPIEHCAQRPACVSMRPTQQAMHSILKYSLCFAHLTAINIGLAANQSTATFFRSDAGIADASSPLPDRFEAPTVLRWRTRVDSGQSSPIVSGERIFLTTWRVSDRELATLALDRKSGKQLWKQKVPADRIEELHPTMGNPAAATPACDGERVFVFFGSVGLICYDLEGRKLWQQALGPFRDEYGASSSPMLVDDKVILCEDHDVDSFLIALDKRTGKVLWKTPRPDALRSYSTPAIWTNEGGKQLLVAGALELASYDLAMAKNCGGSTDSRALSFPLPLSCRWT
jgi:outer membrane protein assembly factor BamB